MYVYNINYSQKTVEKFKDQIKKFLEVITRGKFF